MINKQTNTHTLMVGKTVAPLPWLKLVAPNCPSHQYILYYHILVALKYALKKKVRIYLMQYKWLILLNFSLIVYSFLMFSVTNWNICIKPFRGVPALVEETTCTTVWLASIMSPTSHQIPFLQERMTDRHLVIQTRVLGRLDPQKWVVHMHHFKENNWQYWLPMIQFKLSRENYSFWKLEATFMSLPAFQQSNLIWWYQ